MAKRQSVDGKHPRHENPIPNASRIGYRTEFFDDKAQVAKLLNRLAYILEAQHVEGATGRPQRGYIEASAVASGPSKVRIGGHQLLLVDHRLLIGQELL